MTKKLLGQFMTTNVSYILARLPPPPENLPVMEPFCGNGDLVDWLGRNRLGRNRLGRSDPQKVEEYDIEPKRPTTIPRDIFLDPPNYAGKFVLTNPPYLARNKAPNKTYFEKWGQNDLFKCFLAQLIADPPQGGIVIVPVNFFCSIQASDIQLRRRFLERFAILDVNVFEEQVFHDTSYCVCSFAFAKKPNPTDGGCFSMVVFPSETRLRVNLSSENNYTIGGEIYQLGRSSEFSITRKTWKNAELPSTRILVKCIDDGDLPEQRIRASIQDDDLFSDTTPNTSNRSYATLVILPEISLEQQETLVAEFNRFFNEQRDKYHSLFLTSFREFSRKRVSFELVYRIFDYLLSKI